MSETELKPVEKITHSYEFTGKDLAKLLNLKGVITSVDVHPYEFKDGDKCKTAFKFVLKTTDRIDLV